MSEYWVKLRGMPYRTTMDDIIEFLPGIKIKGNKRGIHFPVSQRNVEWGEAFIELESEDDLNKAKDRHNQHMGRRYIEVFTSSKADMIKACKDRPSNIHGNGRERSRTPVHDRINENYVLRLKGLPYNISKADIKEFFKGLKILPDGMSILVDHNGKALGDAFVQFATYHDAKLAKERNGNKISHRHIDVFDSNIEEANNEIGHQMEMNEMYLSRFKKSSPLSRGAGPRSMIDGMPYPEADRFYRQNPVVVNMKAISIDTRPDEIFRFFRPLVPLNITMRFMSGSSSGEVDAEFANEDEAYNAMAKNRDRLGNHSVLLTLGHGTDEFSYYKPQAIREYDRREREMSRGMPGGGSGGGGPDPHSRYY